MWWRRRAFLATVGAFLASCVRRTGGMAPSSGDGDVDRLRTPLCRELGIRTPIFSVGFGESAGPELAAAVSRAGGCGVLGTGGGMPLAEIRRRIRRVRELTDRPFGVDVIIAALDMPDADEDDRKAVRDRVGAAIAERIPVLVLFWGDPSPFVEPAHRAGTRVIAQVGSLEEARAAASAGVDGVIAQGVEAGGHVRGTTSIWKLLPDVALALRPLPVLAAGGIGDGAGVARAVGLGTRFVASEEAWIHPAYKARVVRSRAEDTFLGALFDAGWPNAPHRVLRNRVVAEWEAAGRPPPGKRPGEGTSIGTIHHAWGADEDCLRYEPRMLVPDFAGDPEYAPMWAGESCSVVKNIRPAGDIVRDLEREARAALAAVRR